MIGLKLDFGNSKNPRKTLLRPLGLGNFEGLFNSLYSVHFEIIVANILQTVSIVWFPSCQGEAKALIFAHPLAIRILRYEPIA